MAEEETNYLNLFVELRVYWLEEGDQAVFHFVDTPGDVVEGWVKALLAHLEEHWEGWTERYGSLREGAYAYQIESASRWVFCNHSNRPDHAKVEMESLYLSVENKSDPMENEVEVEVTFRRKGWENGMGEWLTTTTRKTRPTCS